MMSPDSIAIIARHLADHPEGVMPTAFGFREIRDRCENFVELTGEVGDVSFRFICHRSTWLIIRSSSCTRSCCTQPPTTTFGSPDSSPIRQYL